MMEVCTNGRERIVLGLSEFNKADLGLGLCKKRIAITGHGKWGSTRTLVAKESANGIFFIVGRQKNNPGSDFSKAQVDAAKLNGSAFQKADPRQIEGLISDEVLKEICNENHE